MLSLKRTSAFIFFLAIMITAGHAQAPKFKIHQIRVEGNVKADSSIIFLNSGLRVGDEITSDDIQKAIRIKVANNRTNQMQ